MSQIIPDRLRVPTTLFPADSQTPHCLLRLMRCRDIEHILRGPVISVFSPPLTISSFMSPWLLLGESFQSGSEHVVVFSLLMLKALAAWGEISHGQLPAEGFKSSKQSLCPNVKNFGNEELPWAALCPKITERACVNLSVFFCCLFIAFLIVSSIIAIAFHLSWPPRAILSSLHITMSVDSTHMYVITLAGAILYC